MYRLDRVADHVKQALEAHGADVETLEACVVGDLDEAGQFGEIWLAVDRDHLWLYTGEVDRIPLTEIEEAVTESYVGSGSFVITVGGEQRRLCVFTNAAARKFIIFAKVVSRLSKGEELREEDFTDGRPAPNCPTCGRLFPEPERKVCPHCVDRRTLTLRIFSFFGDYKWHVVGVVLLMIAGAGLNLLAPYINGRVLFDDVLTPGGRYEGKIVQVILVMALFQLLAIGINILHSRIAAHMTAHVIADLKSRVFNALQRLSLGFFTNKQTGGLMTRVNGDADNLQYFFHDGFPYFIVNLLQIILIVTVMVWMNWRLALMVLLPIPLIMFVMGKAFPRLWRLFSRRYRANRSLNAVVNDSLTGIRVVKAFGKEEREIERFSSRNDRVYNVTLATGFFSSTLFPTLGLMMNAGGLIVWGVGGWDVLGGRITFGTLMTFSGYLMMLYGPLDFMTHVVDWWTSCINSAQRIFEILDWVPDVVEKSDPIRLKPMKGEIELRNVTFGYEPNKPALKNVSFHVKPGEMIGLVGHSGAGKSTLTNIISRLYDVEEGQVLIDGIDVRDLSYRDLRAQIGIVPQETYLFRGTILENIAYAKPDADRAEIIQAAKAAGAHDFIVKLPDGYETIIGVRGQDLSGGERQRIAIARAILHNPRILILDEATASVDTQTERLIQMAFKRLVEGRTTIAIAHRFSTLRDADRLIVVDKGEIVEIGTHEELEARRGVYYNLWEKQKEALAIRGVANEDRSYA